MMKRSTLLSWILVIVYAAPVCVYVFTFGFTLSTEHTRWAEFGSALAGIYAPIVAVSTLAVLFVQVALQKQINNHQYDQAHFQQARADIEFYATRLAIDLEAQLLPGQSLRTVLNGSFQSPLTENLDDENLRAQAANIDANAPSAFGLWNAVYPILEGLSGGRTVTYDMTLGSSIQKLIAMLGFGTCVALDNYHRIRSEGRLKISYRFSPLLIKEKGSIPAFKRDAEKRGAP
jgi:hypothetical protein